MSFPTGYRVTARTDVAKATYLKLESSPYFL
nr:MAG TPA: hypothetical protein [Caudoviricetes sp.]